MMNDDALKRSLFIYTLIAKGYSQLRILASEEQDGRYNNWCTQAYGLLQDIQDKIREERVDAPIQIGSAPNIPTPNPASPVNSGPQPNPTINPVSSPTAGNPVSNGGAAVPNPGGMTNQQIADFYSGVLAGRVSTNTDLNDLLNQMMAAQQGQANPSGNNQPNF